MKIKNTLIAALLLLCFACSTETKTVTVKREKYSIELPDYLSETSILNEEASLQYQNLLKQFFVIALDESKTELQEALLANGLEDDYSFDLEGYSELMIENFREFVGLGGIPDFTETTINGMRAFTVDIEGTIDGEVIYWKVAYIEGKNNFYQLLVWTGGTKKKQYEEQMQDVINSFRETDKSRN